MIEILALAGAVTKIGGSISTAIRAGKDMRTLMPQFGKIARLESEIQLAEQGKHKNPLGRLTSSEEEGLAIAQAKIAHKEAMDELREICSVRGVWETVKKEMAAARKRHKAALEEEARRRDQMFWALGVTAAVIFAIVGTGLMIWGIDHFYNG